ncbi:MAG: hypothetical protein HY744_10320 [Deltaproteobacteria bacterium]|nr:hypothetical protein [Deltaproteobacteria bacterium]
MSRCFLDRPALPALLLTAAAALGCSAAEDGAPVPGPPPLGMILRQDGVVYAGAAIVDITPTINETYTDLDDDSEFDGCLDNPQGGTAECPEPFDDANHNGWFDAVWMGGFGPLRPALGVSDPISTRALVIAQDGGYLVFVVMDLVGLGSPRIYAARDQLAAQGLDPGRLIVASTHNHQGPDTMGLWGDPYDMSNPVTGIRESYQQLVTGSIEQAVREAAGAMQAVTLKVGAQAMRERSPHFNGSVFGGDNPTAKMHGMINDIRDPVIASDELIVLQGVRPDGSAVFTWTIWAGHPEVWGGNNTAISADWPGVMRPLLEHEYGGVAIHSPECLGGMQSALGGDLPLVDEDGTHRFQICSPQEVEDPGDAGCYGRKPGAERRDKDGNPVPQWAEHHSHEFVVSHGHHIAEAAIDVLAGAKTYPAAPLAVAAEPFYVPLHNIAYNLLGKSGIFDLGIEDAVTDDALCPELSVAVPGCIPVRAFRLQLGPLGLVTAPAEILPELVHGFPDSDPRWHKESSQLAARGSAAGSAFFPQHDPKCNEQKSFEPCRHTDKEGECDCLSLHAFPYALSFDASVPPVLDLLGTEYRAALSMVDSYMSYMIPEPDFNLSVSLLSEHDGDHYEDTVSPSYLFATRWQEAQRKIAERWGK